jgi:hypothetical protein
MKLSAFIVDKSLQTNVFNCITKNCANMTVQKREQLADGLVRISKGLKKSVNGTIIQHGFNRTGLYLWITSGCLSNCHKLTIERLGHQKMADILEKIPDIANLYLSESGGQIKEEEFDAWGIPAIENDDRRTMLKHERCLSHQRAVIVNWQASVERRKTYLETKKNKKIGAAEETTGTKQRKRRPNRQKR